MCLRVDPVVKSSEFEHNRGHIAIINLLTVAQQIQREVELKKQASHSFTTTWLHIVQQVFIFHLASVSGQRTPQG